MTPHPPLDDARVLTARAMRRLGHAVMRHEADDDVLRTVADAADTIAAQVEAQPRRSRDLLEVKRRFFEVPVEDGAELSHFDECFVSGSQNPMGIGLAVTRAGDEVVGRVELGAAFEGAPGRAHGGIVAAIFDDILGYLITVHRTPAFTGELHVRYLAPTPMGVPLEYRARLLERDGRKLHCSAEATADGVRIAEATATFIAVEVDRFRA